MEKMEVEIISTETIRPSSPTPPHLRTFKLSFLDQLPPNIYTPITFFYTIDDGNLVNQMLQKLKASLPETLSIFYPLAGRIKDHLSIDCNDEGLHFSVAKVKGHLLEFLKKPDLQLLSQFLPGLSFVPNDKAASAVQISIQVSVFSSGGIAISLRFLHRIGDAATIKAFLECWGAKAISMSGGVGNCIDHIKAETYRPDFTASELIPLEESRQDYTRLLIQEKWFVMDGVWGRFVFDAKAISQLKDEATSEAVPNPSSFEAVTGFLWKSAMSTAGNSSGRQASVMLASVNVRPRIEPPMPTNAVGNLVWAAKAYHKGGDDELDLKCAAGALREAVLKINGDFVRSLQGDERLLTVQREKEELCEMSGNGSSTSTGFMCSSWCRFGFYDLDFGWGKPVWVAYTGGHSFSPSKLTLLMDTRSGGGVEAWMLLAGDHLAKLQSDPEFLTFASVNPSISIPFL